jgi:tripartite-type tricarboxylate transporter receptor subunit TctC
MFGVVPSSLPYIRNGQMRALAVTTEQRLAVLPEVPAMAEFLPGYEASGWYGIAAPKDTPREIVETLNAAINAGLTDPKVKVRLAELGCLVYPGSPAEFSSFVADEIDKWAKVIRTAGIKPE